MDFRKSASVLICRPCSLLEEPRLVDQPLQQPPCANALLIAERVYRDVETGEWIIAGVFNQIILPRLPHTYGRFDIFFQITDVSRPVDLTLRLEHSDGTVIMNIGGPIRSESPLAVIEKAVHLHDVRFEKAGKYFVQLMSQEQLLIAAPLHVIVRTETTDAHPSPESPESTDD